MQCHRVDAHMDVGAGVSSFGADTFAVTHSGRTTEVARPLRPSPSRQRKRYG